MSKRKPLKPTKNLFQRVNTWYMRVVIEGKEHIESLHTSDLATAITRRDNRLIDIFGRADRRREKADLERIQKNLAIMDADEEQERNKQGRVLLEKAFAKFEKDPNRRDCKPRQLSNHRSNWKRFLNWMQKAHPEIKYIRQVTPAIAREWSAAFWETVKATQTYNHHLTTVHYVFEIVSGYEDEMRNPFEKVKQKKVTDSVPKQPFTEEELKAIFSFPEEEFKRLCAIGLYTTLRFTNARKLTWEMIDGDILHATHTKTGADATQTINQDLRYWLDRVPEAERHGYITPMFAEKARQPATILFQSYLQKAGIRTQKVIKGLHNQNRTVCIKGFHSFRHTAITLALQNGASVSQVKRLAGHASEKMQERYTHLGAGDAGAASSKIGRFWQDEPTNQEPKR